MRHRYLTNAAIAAYAALIPWSLGAQDATPEPAAAGQQLTASQIESLQQQVESATDLPHELKKQTGEHLKIALAETQRAETLAQRVAQHNAGVQEIPKKVSEIKERLAQLKGAEPPQPDPETPLAQLEQALSESQLRLTEYKSKLAEVEAAPKTRTQRSKEIREKVVAVPARLEEIDKHLAAATAHEPPFLGQAKRAELEARRLALQLEPKALESELALYGAEESAELLSLRRDRWTFEVSYAERYVKLLEEAVKARRAKAAEEAVEQARNELISADPVLKQLAIRNSELAKKSLDSTKLHDEADQKLQEANDIHEALGRQYKNMKEKVDAVGLTSAVGAMLRKQASQLPDIRQYKATVRSRRQVIDAVEYQRYEYEDEKSALIEELAHFENALPKYLQGVSFESEYDRRMHESAVRDMLERRSEYLTQLKGNYDKYSDKLFELDSKEQQIITLTRDYRQYIDERVLWIRSGSSLTSLGQFDLADSWLISGPRWISVAQTLIADAQRFPFVYLTAFSVCLILVLRGARFRREIKEIGEQVRRPGFFRFIPTLRALLLTMAISVAWPGIVAFLAWRLHSSLTASDAIKAIGAGLLSGCAVWFPLEFVRQFCRRSGLAEAHFGWSTPTFCILRQNLGWLIPMMVPLMSIPAALAVYDPTHTRDAIERSCFILSALALAAFLYKVLHPTSGMFREYIAYHKNGWVDRLKHGWHWMAVAFPLALAGLTYWGYYYTAQVLTWRLYATACFMVVVIVARELLTRLILLRRRKLSIEQSRQRAAAVQGGDAPAETLPAGIITEDDRNDISVQSAQTQRFLAASTFAGGLVGLWLIWVPVLPAVSMLDRYPLWEKSTAATSGPSPSLSMPGMLAASEGEEAPAPIPLEPEKEYVTFSDLAFAILVIVIMIICARNVPGLLEISVLQRLPLDASVRYAITSLTSYAIVMIGVVVACGSIGLRWSQIQWLATALTFGLAFGLQEMFANFVAGVIILFERPIRVGDIVTVDDITGVVSRIRIRATSITNWDRKEYVVPNKEFITGRLLNWTLSDKVNRIVIEVGVAYGSDTRLTRELLLQVAENHPLILKEPPTLATFEGFGDNSLNFVLRTYLPNLENRLQVIHELHTEIDLAFREAGIEIAFPQRDLHIRTTPEGLGLALSTQETSRNNTSAEAA